MSSPTIVIDTSILDNQNPGRGATGEHPHSNTRSNNRLLHPTTTTSLDDDDDDDAVSVATTALASEVGSFVGRSHDAFLRSVTFECSHTESSRDWGITFRDISIPKKRKQIIEIDSISGIVALSKLQIGDRVKYINGKKLGPSYNAERATQQIEKVLKRGDGYLSITTGNSEGIDILVQVTVIKSKPTLTYKDLGLIVWYWGTLCVKSISKDSIFHHSVLKSGDAIVSINDIDCQSVTAEGFEHIINELPKEITIVVKRGKQRWTGKFG